MLWSVIILLATVLSVGKYALTFMCLHIKQTSINKTLFVYLEENIHIFHALMRLQPRLVIVTGLHNTLEIFMPYSKYSMYNANVQCRN